MPMFLSGLNKVLNLVSKKSTTGLTLFVPLYPGFTVIKLEDTQDDLEPIAGHRLPEVVSIISSVDQWNSISALLTMRAGFLWGAEAGVSWTGGAGPPPQQPEISW